MCTLCIHIMRESNNGGRQSCYQIYVLPLPWVYHEGELPLDIVIEGLSCGWWPPRSWWSCCTCEWQLFLYHQNPSHPLPAVVLVVRHMYGVSASWRHTRGLVANAKLDSPATRDCGWQDWRRETSEHVNTNFDGVWFQSRPPRIWTWSPQSVAEVL